MERIIKLARCGYLAKEAKKELTVKRIVITQKVLDEYAEKWKYRRRYKSSWLYCSLCTIYIPHEQDVYLRWRLYWIPESLLMQSLR